MNTALKLYDALFIIPMLQVIWLVFGVLGGGIFYDEFSSLSPLAQSMFAVGIVILIAGVLLLAPRQKKPEETKENKLLIDSGREGTSIDARSSWRLLDFGPVKADWCATLGRSDAGIRHRDCQCANADS
jgi:hypothetical protein